MTGTAVSPFSATVTVKAVVAVFPWTSPAEQVTVVTPTGKVAPEAWSQPTATGPSTRSVAVGEAKVTAAPLALVAVAVRLGTAERTGAVVSFTTTVKALSPT